MASASRTKQFADVQRVLKRYYKPVRPDAQRPVLEHLLFACCLENAHYEPAEEAFAALVHTFFDWNEVRVTSIRELAEVMAGLPDPRAAANRLKRVLQSIFEATYSFDLEDRRKKSFGPTIKWLSRIDGSTSFIVAYVVQSALGGHAIPVDSGVLQVLRMVELISDKDREAGVVPGLERAVSKAKGTDFGSMLHQLGADFTANPYSPSVRQVLLEINPDVADRFPKRRAPKMPRKKPVSEQAQPGGTTEPQTAQGKHPADDKKAGGDKGTSDGPKSRPQAAAKKPAATKKKVTGLPEKTAASKIPSEVPQKRKPASKRLSKRKPR